MKKVKKLNRELCIPEDRLDDYLENGYVELDSEGNEIRVKTKNDISEEKYIKRIQELEKENEELKRASSPTQYDLLKIEAKDLKIPNYSKMKKDELQKAVEDAKAAVNANENAS